MENQHNPSVTQNQEVISIGDWMITILIAAIPILGFIMLFVWAFGGGSQPSKANWAKATLLWLAIMAVFYGIIVAIFGAFIFSNL
ncbi:MAG: hypothetical protein EA391_08090 [Balneolaceae bacterium]|nr:MAG: hypothetical protein EA391_08090 [Balneolaceae bacterium]